LNLFVADLPMPETNADRYRRKAEECRHSAEKATNDFDRKAWQSLAREWAQLATPADNASEDPPSV
jgi:hypothetical protein